MSLVPQEAGTGGWGYIFRRVAHYISVYQLMDQLFSSVQQYPNKISSNSFSPCFALDILGSRPTR